MAREQEVSSSINENYQSPAPAVYQAEIAPVSTYSGSAAPPPPPPPPPPPSTYRQPFQQNGPQRKRQSQGAPPRPGPNNKNYQVDPRAKKIPIGKAPEALPNPLPLQAEEEVRSQESLRHRARAADSDSVEEGEAKQAGGGSGIANFLGIKLPELPTLPSLPSIFGGKKAAEKAEVKPPASGEAIPISLGVKPKDNDFDEDVSAFLVYRVFLSHTITYLWYEALTDRCALHCTLQIFW